MEKYLTVKVALSRLPVKMAEREFRKRVRAAGLCYRHGHQVTLSEDHLTRFIQTLECQPEQPSAPRRVRTADDAMRRARELLAERKKKRP